MKFGIVGYGRFGKLWANVLEPYGEVIIYDDNIPNISNAEILFILTPISEFESACQEIKKFLDEKTLIIDCCSVKMYSVEIMRRVFGEAQPMIATHPLFGPDSVKRSGGLKGHKIVVCPLTCEQEKLHAITALFKKMGLQILITTPEDHDRQMANSQGLVHFIGRGLDALSLQQQELATPDFQALININKMVINDSWQLFLDMHSYNPFTKEIRQKLLQQLIKINDEVNANGNN